MEKMIRNKFWRKVRAMVVAAGAVMMVAGNCWGYTDQSTITINPNVPAAHGIRENVVYAVPGKPKRIEFQDISNDNNKLDGYVRWYVEDGGNVTTNNLSPLPAATNMIKYANGYVWLRKASTVTVGDDTHCWAINYTLPSDKDEVVVVCEASSLNNGTTSGSTFTAPMVTVVRRYTVRKASVISSELSSKKTNLDNNYSTWRTNISTLAKAEENTFRESSANFIESYEIHTSLSQGTNYRLGEILSNYYVGSTEATDIRWSAFKADGTRMTTHIASVLSESQKSLDFDKKDHPSEKLYIWKHKFTETEGIDPDATTTQVIYITAEVTTDNKNYYPAMFLKVYLEPFTEPLTQTELNTTYKNNANYYLRFYDHLAQDQYQQIVAVNFDEIDSENKPMTWNELTTSQRNNFSTKPVLNEETAYAFTNPLQYAHRKANRITAGQGEYGLYRTLNYTRDGIAVSPDRTELEINDGGTVKPQYQEAWVPGYKKYMVDRLFDETKGTANEKYGFFYFLDATDDPGTVVKIHLNSELCNNTQLVVSAWICDTKMGSGFDADLGIAFIGRKKADDPSTEVVLNRFYSGEIYTKPPFDASVSGSGEYEQAQWQQIYYTFTIPGNVGDYEEYYVEILNNAPSTAGADYAVDDIRVYKSTPNVQVKRDNECDASTLIVGTDYATILRNMGWTPGDLVANEQDFDNFTDVEFRKYRYGLMGKDHKFKNSTAGNVYFAFVEQDLKTWKVVNKQAQNIEGVEKKNPAAMSLRVAVSTVQDVNQFEFYVGMTDNSEEAEEKAKEQAQLNERIMNYRAVKDYLADYETYWKNKHHAPWPSEIDINDIDPESNNFDEDKYQEAMVELFARRLEIPRLRCPWYDETNKHLYLAIIDVNNTDLKYNGQINADGTSSDGTYWVVTFSAEEVAGHGDEQGVINVKSECTLKSLFTIDPATTVLIDAISPGAPDIAVCMGTVHEIVAYLNFYDKDTQDPIPAKDTKDLEYIFDWYLGPLTEYDGLTATNGFSVKDALNAYRTAEKNSLYPIEKSDLQTWTDAATDGSEEKKMGTLLLDLMDNGKLLLGTLANEPFDMPINTERMVAMPYLPEVKVEGKNYDFCSAETEVNLQAVSPDNPEIFQGFVKVEYNNYTDVALRLGQPNMDGTTLELPIHKVSNMANNATRLGLASNSIDITLIDESGTPHTVGTATSLDIPKTDGELTTQATLTFSLNATAKAQMQEGSPYTLLIPFVQYAGDTQLNSECDGTLELPVKIVPEYLTWKGGADDDWYKDKKWNQSTKGELHLGEPVAQDANGSDIVTNAFSPLYFSNITILGDTLSAANRELQLDNTITKDDNQEGTLSITDNIKYDLAVADKDGKITPYYIYNVDEIYFKPGATLLNQHLLSYTKAHVEFTMTNGKAYWMASPLQDVYAGDMYAPVAGKQHTPAFGEITYNVTSKNDRWEMPFYQKAWNKAVAYSNNVAGTDVTEVAAVQSNWNIEYNDVWVPYTIGKGFYSRVEERDALVRLPKDDASYGYETKALSSTGTRTNAGKLAALTDGSMSLDLSKVDNDGNHFLIGNPYMAYLDMSKFLAANTTLAEKYWTVDGKNGVIVGTPDVKWPTGSELTSGYIAPMQAFFVERKGYTPPTETTTRADETTDEPKTVTFNADMTVPAATASTSADTKAFAATNPVLTLTASSKQGQSRAAVVQKSDASNQYEADKDAVALLDSEIDAPMAYTIAGNYAAAVNAIHDYKNVPLGVYAKDGEEVELTIEGASQLVSPLYLYDAVTRSTTPIDGDSFTLNLTGSSHGRYFLTTDEGIKAEGDIRIYSPADGQLIIASTPSDRLKQVQVYDLNGRMVESRQNVGTATCQLYVPGGIYIVRVQSEQGEAQAKLKIK